MAKFLSFFIISVAATEPRLLEGKKWFLKVGGSQAESLCRREDTKGHLRCCTKDGNPYFGRLACDSKKYTHTDAKTECEKLKDKNGINLRLCTDQEVRNYKEEGTGCNNLQVWTSTECAEPWRQDGKCGANGTLSSGKPAECDPDHLYCCSSAGYCGTSDLHCKCNGCQDYRSCKTFGFDDCPVGCIRANRQCSGDRPDQTYVCGNNKPCGTCHEVDGPCVVYVGTTPKGGKCIKKKKGSLRRHQRNKKHYYVCV